MNQILDIAPMPWSLSDDHFGRSCAPAQLNGSGNDERMGVDDAIAVIFDQIGLDDDPLAGQGHALPERCILSLKHVSEVGVVVAGRGNVDGAALGELAEAAKCFDRQAANGEWAE